MNGAAKVINELDYDRWYLGGHSLGGVVASLYLQKHPDAFEGLILFASYTNKQMPEGIKEIVIVGSNDGVINWEALEKGRELASDDYEEHIIEGGNHAQFGSYGLQRGDGQAGISPQEQIRETVEIIIEAINR
jgi:predicted esterase